MKKPLLKLPPKKQIPQPLTEQERLRVIAFLKHDLYHSRRRR